MLEESLGKHSEERYDSREMHLQGGLVRLLERDGLVLRH
jgi:hypothetical protein